MGWGGRGDVSPSATLLFTTAALCCFSFLFLFFLAEFESAGVSVGIEHNACS